MGTRKGCYQCTKRRIICDMTEPRCLKCTNKGLDCSGNGLRYRFNDGIASRGKLRGRTTPMVAQACQQPARKKLRQSKNVAAKQDDTTIATLRKCGSPYGCLLPSSVSRNGPQETGILPSLEFTSGEIRFSFDYFSSHIAPGMVVLDDENNGYRNLILPFALQDELVRMAVTSITRCRLSRAAGRPEAETRAAAEMSRAKVIEKLMQQSAASEAANVFTVSSWMAVLVLFIGELVLGGDQYEYLLRMMCSMKRHGVAEPNPILVQFLDKQTEFILHLAQPFVGSRALGVADTVPGKSLRSVFVESQTPTTSSANQEVISIVAEAGEICYNICKTCDSRDRESRQQTLDYLRRLVSQVPPCTAGGNSLVWVYFIGAADSETVEDHVFFTSRLVDIYNYSGWDNIASGLAVLRDLWQYPSKRPWSHILPKLSTALVM